MTQHISFATRAYVQNTLSAVLALKTKSNPSKQKEIVVTYWCLSTKSVFLLKMGELMWKLLWKCVCSITFLAGCWQCIVEHTIWFSSTTRERPILHVALIVVMSRHIAQSRIDSVTPPCARLPLRGSRLPRQMLSSSLWCGLERAVTFTMCHGM